MAGLLRVMAGAAGAGKSTWLDLNYQPYQIVSTDHYRGVCSDDPANQEASADAFEMAYLATRKRLKRGLTVAFDSTAATAKIRAELVEIADEFEARADLIIMATPLTHCLIRNGSRTRPVPADRVNAQHKLIDELLEHTNRAPGNPTRADLEGFHSVSVYWPGNLAPRLIRVAL